MGCTELKETLPDLKKLKTLCVCVCVCVLRERKWDSQPYSVLWKESMNTRSMGVSFFPRLGESEVSLKDVLEMLASPNISDIVTPKHEI